ncbi:MAG: GAF and ANTAR domain-containing protein [Frankiales bacterium]|nr:GAF and ANTAR domain-containing protein [Frankiales bacterium]
MSLPDAPFVELLNLSAAVLSEDDLPTTLGELCRIATRAVPCADGASITTFPEGKPSAVASDDWAKGFDEIQYEEHEGPCLDAYRTGNAFRVRDLAAETRWPSYVPRASERGASSMVSIPLAAQGTNIGALNLYSKATDAFGAAEMSIAVIVGAHVGLAVQVAAALFGHRDLAVQLGEAMRSRAAIEQAKGILMAGRRCTAEEAFEILVNLSQTTNRKLRDVAVALVDEASRADGERPA